MSYTNATLTKQTVSCDTHTHTHTLALSTGSVLGSGERHNILTMGRTHNGKKPDTFIVIFSKKDSPELADVWYIKRLEGPGIQFSFVFVCGQQTRPIEAQNSFYFFSFFSWFQTRKKKITRQLLIFFSPFSIQNAPRQVDHGHDACCSYCSLPPLYFPLNLVITDLKGFV